MKDTFSILFYLKNSKKKINEKLIYCRITICSKEAPFSTKLKVNPALWNQQDQCATGRSKAASKINTALAAITTDIVNQYDRIKKRRKRVDAKYLLACLQGQISDKENVMVVEFFDKYIKYLEERVLAKDLSKDAKNRYIRVRDRLKVYIKEKFEREDIFLDEIDIMFTDRFNLFIREKYPCENNTAQKHIQILKTVITSAWGNGYLVCDKLIQYKLKFDKYERTCLNWDELKRLMQKKFCSERLEKVRDVYVFECFTGFAYSDTLELTEQYFELMNDNNEWINKERCKTKIKARIILSAIPYLIIEKYKDQRVGGRLLPVISNQKMNEYLKEIAVLCNINKNLTTHTARHTFATTVTLTEDVPIETVSKMLGHTNITTTQIYAKIVDKKLRKDAEVWNNKMIGIEKEFNLENK